MENLIALLGFLERVVFSGEVTHQYLNLFVLQCSLSSFLNALPRTKEFSLQSVEHWVFVFIFAPEINAYRRSLENLWQAKGATRKRQARQYYPGVFVTVMVSQSKFTDPDKDSPQDTLLLVQTRGWLLDPRSPLSAFCHFPLSAISHFEIVSHSHWQEDCQSRAPFGFFLACVTVETCLFDIILI